MAEIEITPRMVWAYTERRIRELNRSTVIILSLLVLLFATQYHNMHWSSHNSPFDKFAESTEDLLRGVSDITLPNSNTIINYKVDCARIANTVEESAVFKNNGNSMASYLRRFGESMVQTAHGVRDMYEQGDGLFVEFDIEIRDMIKALRSEMSGSKFLHEHIASRITGLRKKIQDYQAKVSKAKELTVNSIEYGNKAQQVLHKGRREAANYKAAHGSLPVFGEREIADVDKILKRIEGVATPLESLIFRLDQYDKNLLQFEALIKSAHKVDESDIERLWLASERLKKIHAAFLKKGLIE